MMLMKMMHASSTMCHSIVVVLIVVVLFLTGGTNFTRAQTADNPALLPLFALAPVSGGGGYSRSEGQLMDWSLRYAVARINDDPQLLPVHRLQVQVFNSRADSSIALQGAIQNIRNGTTAAVIGDLLDSTTIAAGSVASIYRIPHISFGAVSTELSSPFAFPSFLRVSGTIKAETTALLAVLRRYDLKSIAVIYDNTAYGAQYLSSLQESAFALTGPSFSAQSPSFSLVFEFTEEVDTTNSIDIQQKLNKIRASGRTQVLVLLTQRDGVMAIMREFASLGFNSPSNLDGVTAGATANDISGNRFNVLTLKVLDASMLDDLTAQQVSDLNNVMSGMISVNPSTDENAISTQMAAACRLELPSICQVLSPFQTYIYDAILSFARAYHEATQFQPSSGTALVPRPDYQEVVDNQILSEFDGASGLVRISDTGDRIAAYDVVNLVQGQFVKAGRWQQAQPVGSQGQFLKFNGEDSIICTSPEFSVSPSFGSSTLTGTSCTKQRLPKQADTRALSGTLDITTPVIWSSGFTTLPDDTDSIKLIFLAPKSAPRRLESQIGGLVWTASQIAVDDINQDASILPNTNLEMVQIDTFGTPMTGFPIAVDVIARNTVAGIVGGFSDFVSEPVAHLSTYYDIPQVSYGAAGLWYDSHPYFNRVNPSIESQLSAIVSLISFYGWRRLVIIHEAQMQKELDYLRDATSRWNNANPNRKASSSFYPFPWSTQEQLDAQFDEAEYHSATSIWVLLARETSSMVRMLESAERKDMLGRYIFIGVEAFRGNMLQEEDADLRVILFSRMRYGFFVSPSSPQVSNSTATRVFTICKERNILCGAPTAQHIVDQILYAYDAIMAFARGLTIVRRSGQTPTAAAVSQAIRSNVFTGATGPVVLDENGDRRGDIDIVNIVNERVVKIGTWRESDGEMVKNSIPSIFPGDTTDVPDGIVLRINELSDDNRLWIVLWSIFLLVGSFSLHGFIFINQNKHAVQAINPVFIHMVVLGTIFGHFAMLTNALLDLDSKYRCQVVPFLLGVSFSISFPVLFAKLQLLHHINFGKGATAGIFRVIKNKEVVTITGAFLIYELFCHTAMLVFDRPEPRLEPENELNGGWTCNVRTSWFFFFLIFPKLLLVFAGILLAFRVRNDHHNFHEGARIGWALGLFLAASAILVWAGNEKDTDVTFFFFIYSGVMSGCQILAILAVMWPLVYHFDDSAGFHRRSSINPDQAQVKIPPQVAMGIASARAEHKARLEAQQRRKQLGVLGGPAVSGGGGGGGGGGSPGRTAPAGRVTTSPPKMLTQRSGRTSPDRGRSPDRRDRSKSPVRRAASDRLPSSSSSPARRDRSPNRRSPDGRSPGRDDSRRRRDSPQRSKTSVSPGRSSSRDRVRERDERRGVSPNGRPIRSATSVRNGGGGGNRRDRTPSPDRSGGGGRGGGTIVNGGNVRSPSPTKSSLRSGSTVEFVLTEDQKQRQLNRERERGRSPGRGDERGRSPGRGDERGGRSGGGSGRGEVRTPSSSSTSRYASSSRGRRGGGRGGGPVGRRRPDVGSESARRAPRDTPKTKSGGGRDGENSRRARSPPRSAVNGGRSSSNGRRRRGGDPTYDSDDSDTPLLDLRSK